MKANTQTAIYLAVFSALMLGSTQVLAVGNNTAYGTDALISVTPGVPCFTCGFYNAAFGELSLNQNTSGYSNTAIGYSSLYFNTTGYKNTATGYGALYSNTTGSLNVANGFHSLYLNSTGFWNTASGFQSLFSNTTGDSNTASGTSSLYQNSTGNNNTATGSYSLSSNSAGSQNTASGSHSLQFNSTGVENAAVGSYAMYNSNGNKNAALGSWAMYYNTTGNNNNAQGESALYSNTTGIGNAAFGRWALYNNTTGSFNMGIGGSAGFSNVSGSGNVFLGKNAGYFETGSNKLYIGNQLSETPLLYGVFSTIPANVKLGIGTITVAPADTITVVNGAHLTSGGVWANASSRELKDNIENLSTEDASKALKGLSPVRYVYKSSGDEEYLGFIAEDVPELVAMNDHKSLSPMDIVAVLTTVTKEQAAKMTEQAEKMTQKDGEIAALRESLARQDERMLQMEIALAEVQRHQADEVQVSSSN